MYDWNDEDEGPDSSDGTDLSGQGCYWEDDVDVERKVWTPTLVQLAKYRAREVVMCADNIRARNSNVGPERMRVITNGCYPGEGYCAIAVIVGGHLPWDYLHSVHTYADGMRVARLAGDSPNTY